jgi:hypothetical protein
MSADYSIEDIWREAKLEIDANHHMAQHHQLMVEQTIGNIAALKLLGDNSVEEAVKNL